MARYISASKLCLAVLIQIYVDGFVPPAASIEVLSFIGSRIDPEIQRIRSKPQKKQDAGEELKALHLAEFKDALHGHIISAGVGQKQHDFTLWEMLVYSMLSIGSLHAMSEFFAGCQDMLSQGEQQDDNDAENPVRRKHLLAGNSPLGLFIRRLRVEFDNLQFPDVIKLWYDFERYRRSLLEADNVLAVDRIRLDVLAEQCQLSKLEHTMPNDLGDSSLGSLDGAPGCQWMRDSLEDISEELQDTSLHDMERLLEFQIERMRKSAGYVPATMKKQLEILVQHASDSSKLVDYARFLRAWYKGDYSSTFEYLHRYFDYAMNNSDKRAYQNVLLQMATIQADFGCYSEAMSAMNQAISVARENKDKQCLHWCLSWLHQHRLGRQTGADGDGDQALLGFDASGLEYLKTVANKDNIPGIQIPALLAEAGLSLASGDPPFKARSCLYQADQVMIHQKLTSFRAAHFLSLSRLYSSLGLGALSLSYCTMALSAKEAPIDDLVIAHCTIAYQHCLAGKYKLGIAALQAAKEPASRNLRSQQYLSQCIGLFKLKRALHNNDLDIAERLISALKAAPADEDDLNFTASLLEVDYLTRTRNLPQAFTLIGSLFTACTDQAVSNVYQRLRLMTAKAKLFAAAGRPQKGFSISLRAVVAAKKSRNIYALLEAVGALAVVLNGLEQYERAFQLLDSARGRVMETQDVLLLATNASTGTIALQGWADQKRKDKAGKQEMLTKASVWAKEAEQAYARLEDHAGQFEMLKKLAALSESLGENEKAKEYMAQAVAKEAAMWH